MLVHGSSVEPVKEAEVVRNGLWGDAVQCKSREEEYLKFVKSLG